MYDCLSKQNGCRSYQSVHIVIWLYYFIHKEKVHLQIKTGNYFLKLLMSLKKTVENLFDYFSYATVSPVEIEFKAAL